MILKILALFTLSNIACADFNISYDVLNCSPNGKSCEVRVKFVKADRNFVYINSCYDIDPNTSDLEYCIEDLEVLASRMLNRTP